ncbi:chromatin accessibility complex protein 1 [Astatotilapia calliptera]|uniref:Chromatin accessibility complex protein 1 n=2 Tax=Haplochromini TaxID=319058 RepID=A0AAX7V0Y4_ASTCA|nr:chromatin accessibility complex protein 1 [Astatotilapia calliptera]
MLQRRVRQTVLIWSDEEETNRRHSSKQYLEVPLVSRPVLMKMSHNSSAKDDQASGSKKPISLPISRVRLIMKSSPDVSSINQDALFLTTKATELFVQHLALSSFNNGSGKETNTLSYSDLANTAQEAETFHFLTDILPKKILAQDYLNSLEQMQEEEGADY